MKSILCFSMLLCTLLGTTILFANPFSAGINRMNSALENSGVQNPNMSIGLKLDVPVEDPSKWNFGLYVPKSVNSTCNNSNDFTATSDKTKPCLTKTPE